MSNSPTREPAPEKAPGVSGRIPPDELAVVVALLRARVPAQTQPTAGTTAPSEPAPPTWRVRTRRWTP